MEALRVLSQTVVCDETGLLAKIRITVTNHLLVVVTPFSESLGLVEAEYNSKDIDCREKNKSQP